MLVYRSSEILVSITRSWKVTACHHYYLIKVRLRLCLQRRSLSEKSPTNKLNSTTLMLLPRSGPSYAVVRDRHLRYSIVPLPLLKSQKQANKDIFLKYLTAWLTSVLSVWSIVRQMVHRVIALSNQ